MKYRSLVKKGKAKHISPQTQPNLLLLPAPNIKDTLYQKTGTRFQYRVNTILITDP